MLSHLCIFSLLILLSLAQQEFFPPEFANTFPFTFPREMILPPSTPGKSSPLTEDRASGRKLGELIHDMSKELYLTINNPFQYQKEYLPSGQYQSLNHFGSPYFSGSLPSGGYFPGMGNPFSPTSNFPYGLTPSLAQSPFPSYPSSPFSGYPQFPIML